MWDGPLRWYDQKNHFTDGCAARGVLGVSACSDDAQWRYYIAVSSSADVDDSLEEYIIPESMWAIFPGAGTGKSIQELEKRIVTEWLPTSGFEFTEGSGHRGLLNPDPQRQPYRSVEYL